MSQAGKPVRFPFIPPRREIGHTFCPSLVPPDVQGLFYSLGVTRFRHLVKSYWTSGEFADFPGGNGQYETFDGLKLIDTVTNGTGGGCPTGLDPIPFNTTDWVSIDIEDPYDHPFNEPDLYTDEDAQEMADEIFEPVIAGLRALLPTAKLSLFNMLRVGPTSATPPFDPERWAINKAIHELVDGIDLSLWRRQQFQGEYPPDFPGDFPGRERNLVHSFMVSAEQGNKPVRGWASATYTGQDVPVPLPEQEAWYAIWSAYDIAGYWILHNEDDLTLPQILYDSLANTEIVLP